MIRFFLYEMFSQVIAAMVRRAGIDIVSLHEPRLEGAADQNVLVLAAREGCCVVMISHKDLAPMTARFHEQRLPDAGVIFVPGSVPTNAHTAIARAIARFAQENPDGLQPYEIRCLNVQLE